MATKHIDADPTTRDAFGAYRVSEKTTVQDSQNVLGFDTRSFYNAVIYDSPSPVILAESSNASGVGVNGSFIGPLDPNSRMVPMELDSTYASGQLVVQLKEYATYTPAKSQTHYHTGIFSPNVSKPSEQIRIVLRTSCGGSPNDIQIAQSAWNADTLDGTGGASNPSRITLATENMQIFWVDAQMLYAGTIRCCFSIGGKNIVVHEQHIANLQNLPSLQNYNLPVRQEFSNVSGSAVCRAGLFDKYNGVFLEVEDDFNAGKAKIWMKCHAVLSEGGSDLGGVSATEFAMNETTIDDVMTPILSIRPKPTFNGFPNNSHIFPLSFEALNIGQNDCILILIQGATITGGAWAEAGDATGPNDRTYEINETATGMSGGRRLVSVPLKGGLGSNAQAVQQGIRHHRVPVLYSRVDDLTILQDTLTIAAIRNSGQTVVDFTTLNIEEIRQ